MNSPRVGEVKLVILPSNPRYRHCGLLVCPAPVGAFEEQVGETVAGNLPAIAGSLGIAPASAKSSATGNCCRPPELGRFSALAAFLILPVGAVQRANLEGMALIVLGQVVLDDPKVLAVVPGERIPKIRAQSRFGRAPECGMGSIGRSRKYLWD